MYLNTKDKAFVDFIILSILTQIATFTNSRQVDLEQEQCSLPQNGSKSLLSWGGLETYRTQP